MRSSNLFNNSSAENGGVLKAEVICSVYKSILIKNVTSDSNSAKTGGALYLSKFQKIETLNYILTNNYGNHASHNTKGCAVAIIRGHLSSMREYQ